MIPHDRTWKRLFSSPGMVGDLLAGFVLPERAGDLDFATLTPWSADHVSDGLRERLQDRIWRVHGHDRVLDLRVCLEFQSAVDRTMAVRILDYTVLLYQESMRNAPAKPLPAVLFIVLYHGRGQWKAYTDITRLLVPHAAMLASYQPSQRHFVLDAGGYTGSLPEGRNRMAELVRLASSRDPQVMVQEFRGILDRWREPEHDEWIKALWQWLGQVHLPMYCPGAELPELTNPREAGTVLDDKVIDWTVQWRAEGRVEGRVEGRAEGQIAVMRRLAARKFGPETADRLAERLTKVEDPERVVEVGEWLLDCGSGDELLDRVARLCETAAADDRS